MFWEDGHFCEDILLWNGLFNIKKKKNIATWSLPLSCVSIMRPPMCLISPFSLNFKPITQILKKQIRSKSSERSGEPIQDKDISSSDKEPYLS